MKKIFVLFCFLSGCATYVTKPFTPATPPGHQAVGSESAALGSPEDSAPRSPAAALGKFHSRGVASYYGPGLDGNPTASGERFNMYDYTCAHLTLPFGTLVTVKSVATGRTVVVRVNDRGPYSKKRIIDISLKAARDLGLIQKGHELVELYLK